MPLKCWTRVKKDGNKYVTCKEGANDKNPKKKKKKKVGETMRKARAIVKESKLEAERKAQEAKKNRKVRFAPTATTNRGETVKVITGSKKRPKRTAIGREIAKIRAKDIQTNRVKARKERELAREKAKKK